MFSRLVVPAFMSTMCLNNYCRLLPRLVVCSPTSEMGQNAVSHYTIRKFPTRNMEFISPADNSLFLEDNYKMKIIIVDNRY